MLVFIVIYAVVDMMADSADESIAGIGFLIMIIMIWPSLAVQTKRWHDRGKSGWWNFISFVPFIGPLWAFIELGFLPGTPGANIYGCPLEKKPSDEPEAPIAQPVNPYLAKEQKEGELIGTGSNRANSWRGM